MRDPLAAFLLLAACHPTGVVVTEVPMWEIYDGDDCILTVRGEPGPITSTAPPPPDGRVTTHPFLSAAAHDAGYEAQLKGILDASSSVSDFLARLRAAGFRVERAR
jgi:hypothetical protein